MPGELLSSPLIEIAQALRDKRVTAQELVEAAIGRHERFGERLNAYSLWSPEQARVVAKAADAAFAAGVAVGPLQGLPVSIKDLFAASGYPCFAGSSCRLPPDPWERDGPLVAKLGAGRPRVLCRYRQPSTHRVCWRAARPMSPTDSRR